MLPDINPTVYLTLVPTNGIEPLSEDYETTVMPLYEVGVILVLLPGNDPRSETYQVPVLPLNYRSMEDPLRFELRPHGLKGQRTTYCAMGPNWLWW